MMISAQGFNYFSRPILEFFNKIAALRRSLQEWIRQEIVDDDPYDEETLVSRTNQVDQIFSRKGDGASIPKRDLV